MQSFYLPGELLEEFFLFFSTEFDPSKFVVSIRTGKTTTISTVLEELRVVKSVNTKDLLPDFGKKNNKETCSSSEANLMSVEKFKERVPGALINNSSSNADSSTKHRKQVQFKVSALIVQDPFELAHNLTQNIPESSYKCIMDLMKDAYKICKSLNNVSGNLNHQTTLLELLTVHKTAKKRKSTNSHSFFVAHQQSQDEVLCPMGLCSTADIFHFILGNLEREFGIKCERRSSAKKQHSENNDSEAMSQATQLLVMPQDNLDPALQMQECIADVGKGQNDGQTGEINGGDLDKVAEDFSAMCTAFENTWTHSRKERRKSLQFHKQTSDTKSEKCMLIDNSQKQVTKFYNAVKHGKASCSTQPFPQSGCSKNCNASSPILLFELKVNTSSQGGCVPGCIVSFEHVESAEFQLFGNFFTVYKDYLTSLVRKQTKS